jgi:hypothetical protein
MNNQTVSAQIQKSNRVVYIKPILEIHPPYKKTVNFGGSARIIPLEPFDLISNPGLELIPDPVDLDI